MLLLIIVLVGVIIYLLRRRPANPYQDRPLNNSGMGGFGSGMGGMMTGALLGYLLSEALISPHQYDSWQNMNSDELRQTLDDQGIMTPAQFDDARQNFVPDDPSGNDFTDSMPDDSGSGSFNNFDDFGGFGGGDDSF
jgi:hypothetical protein